MCSHVTSVSTLKCDPLSSTSLRGPLKGEDTSSEICLICGNGLFCCCLRNTVLCMNACADERAHLSQTAVN